jgi:hypothetical protein
MVNVSEELRARFNALLVNKAVPDKYHNQYRKWLRYYLDFCHKYLLPHADHTSLPGFIKKLREKHQTQEQQKQASHAVSLYYGLLLTGPNKDSSVPQPFKSQTFTKEREKVTLPLASSHQERGEREKWTAAYTALNNAYRLWGRS